MRALQPSAGCRRPLVRALQPSAGSLLQLRSARGHHPAAAAAAPASIARPPLEPPPPAFVGSGAIVAAGSSQPTSLFEVTHRAAGYNEAGVAKLATTRRATGLGSSTNIYTRGHRVRRASPFQFRRGGAPSPGPSRRPGGRRCVLLSLLRELFPNPPFGVAAVVRAPRYRHGLLAVASSNGVGWSLLPGCSCAFGTRRSLFRGWVMGIQRI